MSQVARLAAALEEKQRNATGTEAAEAPAES